MTSTSLTDYYNSRVNFDKINPLIRSAYNTTFDFDDYKQQLLTKPNYSTGESTSTLNDSLEHIRREQSNRLAQLEQEFQNLKKTPVFDLPFYAQDDEQYRPTTVPSKPPVPTASRRSPSPVFANEEEQIQHHVCHRPVSAGILRQHDHYHVDFSPHHTLINTDTSSLHDSPSNHIENQIHSMWNEYELDDYMEKPKARRPPTNSSWAGRVTKPQPFCLTNSTKMHKIHHKSCVHQLQEEKMQKEIDDEMMLNRSFKANPVPAHVRMPLYEQLRDEQRARREQLHHMTREYLDSISKPFAFESREKSKQVSRRHSISGGDTARREPQFRAKPLPDFYYRTTKDIEGMKEKSLYRSIKKEMRAKELLRQSRLPTSMKQREHRTKYRRSMSASDLARVGLEECTFKPKTNGYYIPDYDKLQSDFLRQTEQMKQTREPTRCQPFLLHTNLIPSRREQILDEIKTEEEMRYLQSFHIKGKQIPTKSTSGMNLSANLQRSEAIPTKTTQAQRMREKIGKKKRRDDEIRNKFEEKFQRSRSARSRRLKENIQDRSKLNDKSAVYKAKKEESTRKVQQDLHRKEDDYARSLDEMNARVYRRPLLLEQREKDKTVRDLERQIRHAMHVAKLTEKDLMRQQFNPPNVKVTPVRHNYSS